MRWLRLKRAKDNQGEGLAWHYSTGSCLVKILQSGSLLPATAGVAEHETPVLWFSLNPVWEETACKSLKMPDGRTRRLTRAETRELAGGLVRFGYPVHLLIPWPEIARAAGIDARTAWALVAASKVMGGDPEEWMGCLGPIPLHDAGLHLDLERDGKWIRVAKN